MIRLINYLRQCFCKHEFEKTDGFHTVRCGTRVVRDGKRISLLCMKCGYHRSFWEV